MDTAWAAGDGPVTGHEDRTERRTLGRGDGGRGVPAVASVRPGPVGFAMAVVLLLLTAGGYVGMTWARAQEVCAEEVAERGGGTAASAVEVAWSWRPVGVRCSWDDGSRTSLWWG